MKNQKWKEVLDKAEEYGFIVQSYGGIAVLATKEEQEKAKKKKEEKNKKDEV
jgi:hypothetical protein